MKRPRNTAPLLNAIESLLLKADEELEEQLALEGFLGADETVETVNQVEEAVNALLESYGKNFIKELNDSVDLKKFFEDRWPKIKRHYPLGPQLKKAFLKEFKRSVRRFASLYLAAVDPDLKLAPVTKRTVTWIEEWSGELATLMKLNTEAQIESVLKKGLEQGLSIEKIAREIADSEIRSPGGRSRTVALTETLRAHSVAQQEAFDQSPSVTRKRWRHSGARRIVVRDNHVAMSNKEAGYKNDVPKDQPFVLKGIKGGTFYPMYPRDTALPPEEAINCHCVLQPIVDESILGLPIEERERRQKKAIHEINEKWAKREADETAQDPQ